MVGQGRRKENGGTEKEEEKGLNKRKRGGEKKMFRGKKTPDTTLLVPGVLLEHILGLHFMNLWWESL